MAVALVTEINVAIEINETDFPNFLGEFISFPRVVYTNKGHVHEHRKGFGEVEYKRHICTPAQCIRAG
jgi:hypothetical protein